MEKNMAIDNKYIGGIHELNFGHSMGSFLSRHYSRHYANELSVLVLSGTGGKPGFVSLANDSSCEV